MLEQSAHMVDMSKLTESERRTVKLLLDGRVHSTDEVIHHASDGDEMYTMTNLKTHICRLRRKLESGGLIISFVSGSWRSEKGYQLSRKMAD